MAEKIKHRIICDICARFLSIFVNEDEPLRREGGQERHHVLPLSLPEYAMARECWTILGLLNVYLCYLDEYIFQLVTKLLSIAW